MAKEEGKANFEEKLLLAMEESGSLCSSFFQLKGAIAHKNYLRLKNRERAMVVQYKAAAIIQAAWRGYLIRENMKLLHAAASKIQALVKGHIGRKRYRPLILACLEHLRMEKLNRAATKIQAGIRGYLSRKNGFDFKKYKEMMRKNSEMQRQIMMINEMEEMLKKELRVHDGENRIEATYESSIQSLGGKYGGRGSTDSSTTYSGGSFDDLVRTSFNEMSKTLSKCRIEELLKYVVTSPSDSLRNIQGDSTTSIKETSSSKGVNLRMKDSLDDLFPPFPEEEGLVKPDPEKVAALKTAIRLLREKIRNENHRRLLKQHYLLRTTNCPGVYSDIYSNELTGIEKELKAVKYLKKKQTKSNVLAQKEMGKLYQREPWRTYYGESSKKNDLQRVTTRDNNTETVTTTRKNLQRQLYLRKSGPNHRITRNGHTLTPSSTVTDTARIMTNASTDANANRIESTKEMDTATAKDEYGNGSVRPILNANTV